MSFDDDSEFFSDVPENFFDLKAKNIDGQEISFQTFRDKKAIVVVNVACACGFTTSNYRGLVDLYSKYKSSGLEILGFPCNQFMNQEKKPEPEIKKFVQSKFNVTFPMFAKIEVNGPDTHPLYKYLRFNSILNKNGYLRFIPWNFTKFLLDRNGKVVRMYKPREDPKQMEQDIKDLLA